MANANSTPLNITTYLNDISNREVRFGAIRCLSALRNIEKTALDNNEINLNQYTIAKNEAVSRINIAAGDVPLRAQGVIMAMAEYIYSSLESGIPNLDKWRPNASMTEIEKAENFEKLRQIFENVSV